MSTRRVLYVYPLLQNDEIDGSLYVQLRETYEQLSLCIFGDVGRTKEQIANQEVHSQGREPQNYLLSCAILDLKVIATTLKHLVEKHEFDIVIFDGDPLSLALEVELQRQLISWTVLTQVTEVVGEKVFCVRDQGRMSEVFPLGFHQIQIWQRASYLKREATAVCELGPLVFMDLQGLPDQDLRYHVDRTPVTLESGTEIQSLGDREVVLVVGAGVEDVQGVALAASICQELNIGLGATRVVTDRGWLPYSHQVGTTGTAIAPKVYMAFGTSGAIQHLGGVDMPPYSIAVNTDAAAPIFRSCNYTFKASAKETLQEIQRLINEARLHSQTNGHK